ncbi:Holliday junction resolvase RuvX [Candidatus Curtissbacteria bacterium]|nr:Holliday junction resolvase RuvX [Candidatus Curtissbacteria bacterium]
MYLGIDLGEKTTGLAVSDSSIATPLQTITHKNHQEALVKIGKIITEEKVDTVVLGFVEGKIKTMFETFATNLQVLIPDLKIIMWDETLTSLQARETLIKLQVPKFKRAAKEHEVAASLILQSYLDNRP